MNKSIDTVLVINDNECIGSDQHYQHIESSNAMNTSFSTTTKNFDTIQIIETTDGWYEVYFNNAYISQCISLSMAYDEVESQLSL